MNAPYLDLDFYEPATLADPPAAYAKMLALGPVVELRAPAMPAIVGFDALTAVLRDRPKGGVWAAQRRTFDNQADLLTFWPIFLDLPQCFLANKVCFDVEINKTIQPKLKRVGVDIGIRMIR